jgi:hypothetical protein
LATKQIEKEKNLGILLHVGEPLEPISWIWIFKKRKLEISQNPPKILTISHFFSLKCGHFWKVSKMFLWLCCLGPFFNKMVTIVHCVSFNLILLNFFILNLKNISLTHSKNSCEKFGPNSP